MLGGRVRYVDVNGEVSTAVITSAIPDDNQRFWLTVLPAGNQPYAVQAQRGAGRGQFRDVEDYDG